MFLELLIIFSGIFITWFLITNNWDQHSGYHISFDDDFVFMIYFWPGNNFEISWNKTYAPDKDSNEDDYPSHYDIVLLGLSVGIVVSGKNQRQEKRDLTFALKRINRK